MTSIPVIDVSPLCNSGKLFIVFNESFSWFQHIAKHSTYQNLSEIRVERFR